MITVGTSRIGYGEERNLVSLPFEEIKVVQTYDLIGIPAFLQEKLSQRPTGQGFFEGFFWDGGFNRVDLFHLYNRISAPPRPWITTFQHYLPLWNPASQFGIRMMAGRSCRRLIAMSDFAFRMQAELLYGFPEVREEVLEKMCILHPSQTLLLQDPEDKEPTNKHLSFVFAHRQFFRMGGKEVLLAIRRLVQERYPIHLTVVSTLEFGDSASCSTEKDVRSVERLFADLYPHVTVHTTLPPTQIAAVVKSAHAVLMPAYHETYGYSVLVAQASATPVVTTDVCAFPEVNDESVGWLIHVPRKPSGEPFLSTPEQRRQLSDTIQEQIYRILKEICNNPAVVLSKGRAAWERVRNFHAPADRATWLTSLYKEVLSGESAKEQ